MEEIKKQRGGARPGAGRKRKGDEVRVTFSCKVAPRVAALIKERSAELGMTVSDYLETLIK